MSLYLGDTPICGGIEGNQLNNPFSLFDFRFSDQILNNTSWLRADTFSWASGAVYVSAYEHLVADITGITAETENIGNHTVTFYRAADGHKICLADQETIVNDIFTTTGVAWYYILDIANQRFKLPRTKFGFTGLRDNVGNYVPESLPNIRGQINAGSGDPTGAFYDTQTSGGTTTPGGTYFLRYIAFDASRSSPTYQDNAPVQERATQMYLYFYVGETIQDANIIAAGQALTDIADLKNASNFSSLGKETVVGWGMPDYSAGVSFTSGRVTPYPCALSIRPKWNGSNASITKPTVVELAGAVYGADQKWKNDTIIMAPAGVEVTFSNSSCIIYPLKGVTANA